jgi:hypothetical protein
MKLARTGKDFLIKNRIRNDRYVDQVFFSSKSDLALFLLFEVDIQRAETKVTRPAAPTIVNIGASYSNGAGSGSGGSGYSDRRKKARRRGMRPF